MPVKQDIDDKLVDNLALAIRFVGEAIELAEFNAAPEKAVITRLRDIYTMLDNIVCALETGDI